MPEIGRIGIYRNAEDFQPPNNDDKNVHVRALAKKYDWLQVHCDHPGTISFKKHFTSQEGKDRVDYYANTDRVKTTIYYHPKDDQGRPRGNPFNKDLVRDNITMDDMENIFKGIRVHTSKGRYWHDK